MIEKKSSSSSSYTHKGTSCSTEGWTGGYNTSFYVRYPFWIVKLPSLQLMYASIVANQGLPKMRGHPLKLVLGWTKRKYVGYSQESMVTITTSINPSGATVDMSASCSTIVVFLKNSLEIVLQHSFLGHDIDFSPMVNKCIGYYDTVNVQIYY